jgi:CubicO group peptidase (beta-lactamase class C family)
MTLHRYVAIALAAAGCTGWAAAADIDWEHLAQSTLEQAVIDHEIPGAVVVVLDRERTLFAAGYGVADVETMTPVTTTTRFEVGSIGKVLTTIAVLQQMERGRLDRHADVNTYLSGWSVDASADAPLTLHHLLTHTGGLNDRGLGYASRTAAEVEPLETHLAANFPSFYTSPGRSISYSNYGFGLAGHIVASVTGTPFTDYVTAEVLHPLDIVDSGYEPADSGTIATGYLIRDGAFHPAPYVGRPVIPAGSYVAGAEDMGRLLQALLRDGTPILSPASVAMMTEVQYTPHPKLMGMAYGLEESRWGDVRGFGKGGMIPGFVSFMLVLPEHGLALFVAVNAGSDDAIDRFVSEAMSTLSTTPTELRPAATIDVAPFAGEHRGNRYDRTSVEKLLRMEIHKIYDAGDGTLAMWHEGAMHRYRPTADDVFQSEDEPDRHLVFERDPDGAVTNALFNDRIAGGYLPVVWERSGYWESNQYVNEHFAIVLIVALSYLLYPIVALVRWVRSRRAAETPPRPPVRRWANLVGVLTSALLLGYIWLYVIPLLKARPELVFGMPPQLERWRLLSVGILISFAVFAVLWVLAARRPRGWPGLAYGLLFLASGVFVGEFFVRWNLL